MPRATRHIPIMMIPPAALFLAAVACSGGGTPQAATPQATAAPPTQDAALSTLALGDPTQDLLNAFLKSVNAYPYRVTQTDVGSTSTATVVYEAVSVDHWHETWDSTSGKPKGEIIFVDGTAHWTSESGGWQDSVEPPPGAPSPTDTIKALASFVTDVQRGAETTWNGIPVWTYTFQLGGGPATALVGTIDGLPHQAQVEFTEPVPVSSTFEYEYGVTLDIQAP
jgi:hypothetical protein